MTTAVWAARLFPGRFGKLLTSKSNVPERMIWNAARMNQKLVQSWLGHTWWVPAGRRRGVQRVAPGCSGVAPGCIGVWLPHACTRRLRARVHRRPAACIVRQVIFTLCWLAWPDVTGTTPQHAVCRMS